MGASSLVISNRSAEKPELPAYQFDTITTFLITVFEAPEVVMSVR
jgi:hypothetical protein